ncbi:M56 family metallopeptidase [uncultured Acetatifactor sp.]|uniref:M56 family metallopeptidase n=1 Tax=uncultured Acetatifactor sp. TaxID=1671927 RepID=UPI0026F3E458|nr:M56 family metallopeptidase [uncultured Acetatifactor sp.]
MNVLQMSFSGAVFITAVVIIRGAAIHKLPKKTFLVLWELVMFRLLIPFSIPSVFSVYTLATHSISSTTWPETGRDYSIPNMQGLFVATQGAERPPADVSPSVSVWFMVWCAGILLTGLFFVISYLRCLTEFRTALPVRSHYVEKWLGERPLKRRISVRQSDRISAPLTYGIFRPVILLPKKMDWKKEKQLQYVLSHEYVHICRYDTVTKLVAALALCIHWFNPFVWVMYLLFNRDIELACDESVIRQLGEKSKSAYSLMLIDMEAAKSGLLPFCNSFSKNAIEERITAVMKTKKNSLFAICIAAVLIVGVTTAFATSAAGMGETDAIPDTDFSDSADFSDSSDFADFADFSEEEFDKLLALRFDGYEDMSVSEFQNKVWELTDTEEYRDLLERFSQNTALYEQKDRNEIASFLFYTLEPLTAEKWQTRDFGGGIASDHPGASDNAMLEFVFSLTIQNADTLTVGEYNAARLGVAGGLRNIMHGKTKEQLRNHSFMQEAIDAEIEELNEKWNTDKLRISVEYSFLPLSELDAGEGRQENVQQGQEHREYPNGTEEDYRSLLDLKTADYQSRSVADFNMDLLEWANESYERMERINIDTAQQDFSVNLDSDELSFVAITAWLSGVENGKYVQSINTGRKEEDPILNQYLPSKTAEENGYGAWCDLFYPFSYHIADKKTLTVGERDACISNMISEIQDFWNGTDIDEMLGMTEGDIVGKLKEIAAEYSNDDITIIIQEDSVSFEKMDERDRAFD